MKFFFLQKCLNEKKKLKGNVLLLNEKAHVKIQAFLKEKNFHPKKSLSIVLHQAIQLSMFCETMKNIGMLSVQYFIFSIDWVAWARTGC